MGVATGVSWTAAGGDMATVEVTLMEGKGNLILTGQLGDVMKESATAALSFTRSRAAALGIAAPFYENTDIHIHVPAGAIPKDGPSAGITMATALISALTKRPVRRDVAMTGEITLRGRVLPVGGVKEKVLAAHRGGIKTFVLPKKNKKDLSELPADVRQELQFHLRGEDGGGAGGRREALSRRRPGKAVAGLATARQGAAGPGWAQRWASCCCSPAPAPAREPSKRC